MEIRDVREPPRWKVKPHMRSRRVLQVAFALVCLGAACLVAFPAFDDPCNKWLKSARTGESDCRAELPAGAVPDPVDKEVFAALFASQPGMLGTVINLAPMTMNKGSGPGDELPEGMEFPREDLHSRAVFEGLKVTLAAPREVAAGYDGSDPQHSEVFQRRFPGHGSILRLSHTYLSGNTAAVYVDVYCGGLCGTGDIYLFEKTPNGWQFQRVIYFLIS
jgi:hypothetical protein